MATVMLLHVLGLWALQAGLLHRVVSWVVPVVAISEAVVPPPPAPAKPLVPPAPPAPLRPPSLAAPVARPTASPEPERPLALPASTPSSVSVPVAPVLPAPVQPSPSPAAPAPVVTATPAPSPKIDLPSTHADYLNNPKPAYPALSRRLGEQGRAVVRVLIGVDGAAQKVELHSSSGFERLDRAAMDTVMRWRYTPGKRGGVPEAMWFNVPINFVLE